MTPEQTEPQMQSIHMRSLILSVLDTHFLQAVSSLHSPPQPHISPSHPPSELAQANGTTILNILIGGGTYSRLAAQNYIPLLQCKHLEHVAVVTGNERWRQAKAQDVRRRRPLLMTMVMVMVMTKELLLKGKNQVHGRFCVR